MCEGKNEKSFPPYKKIFSARSAPKIFWSDVPDPPVSSVSFWLTPLPPLSARQFLAYPPTPLSQLVSVFGKPPSPAKVLTSFLNGPLSKLLDLLNIELYPLSFTGHFLYLLGQPESNVANDTDKRLMSALITETGNTCIMSLQMWFSEITGASIEFATQNAAKAYFPFAYITFLKSNDTSYG